MNDFKIRFNKKYISDCVKIGLVMTLGPILFNMLVEEKSILTIVSYLTLIVGIPMLLKSSRFLFNGRVYATITSTYVKFANGKKIILGDINSVYIMRDLKTQRRYETTYILTKSGRKIKLAQDTVHELSVYEVKSKLEDIINKSTVISSYDEVVDIQYSKLYIILLLLIGTPLIMILFNVVVEKKMFAIIVETLFLITVYTVCIAKDRKFVSLYSNKLILRNGEEIKYKDIYGPHVEFNEYRRSDKQLIRTIDKLFIRMNDGRKISICTSNKFNYTPTEAKNILCYKLKKTLANK